MSWIKVIVFIIAVIIILNLLNLLLWFNLKSDVNSENESELITELEQ